MAGTSATASLCLAWDFTSSLLQEHLTSFGKASGVSEVSLGSVVGIRVLEHSFSDHPKAAGSITGGSGCSVFPQTATLRWVGTTFSLNASFV